MILRRSRLGQVDIGIVDRTPVVNSAASRIVRELLLIQSLVKVICSKSSTYSERKISTL